MSADTLCCLVVALFTCAVTVYVRFCLPNDTPSLPPPCPATVAGQLNSIGL